MKTMWALNQGLFATIGGILGYFLGGLDGFITALVAFTIADYITGTMRAWSNKTLSSATGFKGIARKITIFILVGIANLIDLHLLGQASILRNATIFFYLSNEGISLLENAAALGLPVPDKLRQSLALLHDKTQEPNRKETR